MRSLIHTQASQFLKRPAFFLGETWLNLMKPRRCSSIQHKETRAYYQVIRITERNLKIARVQFEDDLEKLHNQFYAMGSEIPIADCYGACLVVHMTSELDRQVVNATAGDPWKWKNLLVSAPCSLQPVSQDLRTVITVKASSDLERVGDHATYRWRYCSDEGEVRICGVCKKMPQQDGARC